MAITTTDAIRVAKLIAIPAPFFLAGYATQASQGALPSLLDKPASASVSSFADIFRRGATIIVPGAGITGLAMCYLAYAIPADRRLWATSTALIIAPLAFTQLVMMGGIQRLLHLETNTTEREKSEKSGEVLQLLQTWTAQNWIRAASYVASGAVALWTIMA